jgi:SAM-dependent methyltransferase
MDIDAFSNFMQSDRTEIICCEACGGEKVVDFNKIGRISRPGNYGPVPISICTNCGYKYQTPRFSENFYDQYYKSQYRKVTFGTDDLKPAYIERQRLRGGRVLDYLTAELGLAPGILLDQGCAYGATMLPFVEKDWKCFGIDPHVPSVEIGSSKLGLDLKVAKGEELPFADEVFDVIISLGAMEHVYSLEKAIKECYRVLKDGGLLLVRWRSNLLWGSPLEYYNHNHFRFFTPETLKLSFERHGLYEVQNTYAEVEGITGAAYYIVQKNFKKQSNEIWNQNNYELNDYSKEIENLNTIKESYRIKCHLLLKIAKNFQNNYEEIYNYIFMNEPSIKFLMGQPSVVVPRAILEAQQFIATLER